MKKNLCTKLAVLMLNLLCAFSLAACGGSKKSALAGTYKLKSVTTQGVTMDLDELADSLGESADALSSVTAELKDDGTFTLDTSALTVTSAIEGTWEEKDGALDLTAEGDTITATVSGSSFKLSSSGVDMTFEKQ